MIDYNNNAHYETVNAQYFENSNTVLINMLLSTRKPYFYSHA